MTALTKTLKALEDIDRTYEAWLHGGIINMRYFKEVSNEAHTALKEFIDGVDVGMLRTAQENPIPLAGKYEIYAPVIAHLLSGLEESDT